MRGKSFIVAAVFVLVAVSSLFTFYSLVYAPSLRPEAGQVTLYFANSDVSRVVPEKRALDVVTTPEVVIQELIKGPELPGLLPTLPQGTRLISLTVANNTANVNFSREVKDNHSGGSAAELMTVYSVVASLTELQSITSVQFLLEGNIEESIWGHMDTSKPIVPDENFIAK